MAENQTDNEVVELFNKGNAAGMLNNFAEAFDCYLIAAEKGYAPAQCNLAFCYEKGHGVRQDFKKRLSIIKNLRNRDLPPRCVTWGGALKAGME